MSLSLEHIDACLPISALKTFTWGEQQFIFQGQGTLFRAVNAITGAVSAQLQVFKRNNVHGFIALNQPQDDPNTVQLLVWGGRSVRVIDLYIPSDASPNLSASSAEFNAPDWIMSGCAAAATGHYGGFLITANNALLSLEVVKSSLPERMTAISIYQLATSVKSILYSADVIALSASHVLMAAGTVFGEIIVWSCFLSEGSHKTDAVRSIHHFFTGHEGSIFNVRISPQIPSLYPNHPGRFLASCSDDRTVRIWDISDCDYKTAQDPSAYSTDGYDLRSTGFGPVGAGEQAVGSESCVVQAFGHAARIWGVYFRSIKNKDQTHVGLVSRGEDCTCVLWDLSWQASSAGATNYQLKEASSTEPHIGKHIWALDLHRLGSETVIYTGGADGALKRFSIRENDDTQLPAPPPPVPEIPGFQRKKKQATSNRARAFAFVSPNCLFCISTNGEIQLGDIDRKGESATTWETLCEVPELGSFAVITGLPHKGLALIGNSRGLVQLYNHVARSFVDITNVGTRPLGLFFLSDSSSTQSTQSPKQIVFLVCYPAREEVTLVTVSDWDSENLKTETVTINLPSTFIVCSAALIFEGQYLMVGSKSGGLALYKTPKSHELSEPILLDRRIHGREFVNHIRIVSSTHHIDGTKSEFVLTCGRDGTYCLHELKLDGKDDGAISMEIVHRTASMIGGNIEGAYVDETTGDFMLYGFRSQEWVLRNESKLTDIITIASGGFRRDWAFCPGTKDEDACFVWRGDASLVVTRIQPDASNLLRAGAHGRELKAVDVFCAPEGSRPLIATGAEDTTVRLFAPTPTVSSSPWGTFECMRVLDTHKSGIQQVSWSKDGRYLFTSAAFEEFFVWRVRAVPSFGIATQLLAASPKDDPNSDLRILSFDLLEVKELDGEQGFLLCLAFSNSTIKIFHFSPSACQFNLLARGTYMTNCLTQAHFLVTGSSVNLITAATDGYFTFWDLTSTLLPFYTITESILEAKDTFARSVTAPADHITCEGRYQIHANSIKGMELAPLSDTAAVIVAGGDDNSLSVSLLQTFSSNTGTNADVATVSIPDAHAAAVTTVKILSQEQISDAASNTETTKFILATSGNDHRVKLWSVVVDTTQPGTQGINVEFLLDRYSAVADVSSLGLLRDQSSESKPGSHSGQAQLVVCGVGMEMFDVTS
ncbi:hypothetical protein N7541_009732 [Penicillium brevicompactum]|uniref:WD repeat protein n=1 Tax=Penicillium brevicompactum TaxID=5074 RepID=A0A9W9UGT6_PENBR|nr:hypothetical protein N7541_009732 [Penicillium brevicompactum]